MLLAISRKWRSIVRWKLAHGRGLITLGDLGEPSRAVDKTAPMFKQLNLIAGENSDNRKQRGKAVSRQGTQKNPLSHGKTT
ncbi:hypothetical protein C2E31_14285 [Rhodopirellula baltica]|nr:hypothetical protein C2E31_14285 [Rhodopirellula baltica]